MIDRQLAYPIAGGRIQLAGNGRIRLKKALRADPQRYVVKVFRQRRLLAEENLLFAFHNGHMHRLNIGGNHLQLRQLRLQPRQRGAQLRKFCRGTQHKTQHHAAVELAFRQQQILQLAAPAGDVIGR